MPCCIASRALRAISIGSFIMSSPKRRVYSADMKNDCCMTLDWIENTSSIVLAERSFSINSVFFSKVSLPMRCTSSAKFCKVFEAAEKLFTALS